MIIRRQATLERFEGKQAVLVLDNGQRLLLAKEELGEAVEGMSYTVQVLSEAEATLARDDLARALLNQLLDEEKTPSISTEAGIGSESCLPA